MIFSSKFIDRLASSLGIKLPKPEERISQKRSRSSSKPEPESDTERPSSGERKHSRTKMVKLDSSGGVSVPSDVEEFVLPKPPALLLSNPIVKSLHLLEKTGPLDSVVENQVSELPPSVFDKQLLDRRDPEAVKAFDVLISYERRLKIQVKRRQELLANLQAGIAVQQKLLKKASTDLVTCQSNIAAMTGSLSMSRPESPISEADSVDMDVVPDMYNLLHHHHHHQSSRPLSPNLSPARSPHLYHYPHSPSTVRSPQPKFHSLSLQIPRPAHIPTNTYTTRSLSPPLNSLTVETNWKEHIYNPQSAHSPTPKRHAQLLRRSHNLVKVRESLKASLSRPIKSPPSPTLFFPSPADTPASSSTPNSGSASPSDSN